MRATCEAGEEEKARRVNAARGAVAAEVRRAENILCVCVSGGAVGVVVGR